MLTGGVGLSILRRFEGGGFWGALAGLKKGED